MPRAAKPFISLNDALCALDADDLCSDLDMIAEDASAADAVRIEIACDALRCAETVETLDDLAANLQVAAEELRDVDGAASVARTVARLLARCTA